MIDYLYVPLMPYGKERRQFIMDWFDAHPEGRYTVNCKHRPQVKDDPDLQKLIKSGFLKTLRQHIHPAHATTYLIKA